jgi:hypothetical protein
MANVQPFCKPTHREFPGYRGDPNYDSRFLQLLDCLAGTRGPARLVKVDLQGVGSMLAVPPRHLCPSVGYIGFCREGLEPLHLLNST